MAKKKRKNKRHKKSSFFMLLLLIFLIGGGVGGYYTADYITRNDMFEVNGEKVVYLELGQDYVEEKASAIAFGKKIEEDKFKIEGNVDVNVAGKYTIKYTVDNIRYRNIARYRIVVVSEPVQENGQEGVEGGNQAETLCLTCDAGGATWVR